MKVLLITDGVMPYVTGGMQKHSAYLAKYLTRSGLKVTLVHCVEKNDHMPSDIEVNKSLFNGEMRLHEILTLQFPKSIYFPGHYINNSYKYSKLVYQKIIDKLNEFDFIYIKGFSGWKLLKEKKHGLKTPPIGVNFHGMNMFLPTKGIKSNLNQFLLRKPALFNMLTSDYVFSYGGKVTGVIFNIGIAKDRIIEIPTGIENQWIKELNLIESREEIQFLFVGRFDLVKGIKELNQAIYSLRHQKFKFHFIGPFPKKNQLTINQVHYHGYVGDPDYIKDIMDQSDVLVLPSYSEGMPNVILEAMARGLAIIATDVGANSLMVCKDNGVLLNNSNLITIKKAIEYFMSMDEKKLLTKKKRSIEKIKNSFSWNEIAKETINKIKSKINPKFEK